MFLEKFPDIESLAKANDESLLKAWEGLGYYRRARMLSLALLSCVLPPWGVQGHVRAGHAHACGNMGT